jgi:transcriptional regulator with XRE-family HTH domain
MSGYNSQKIKQLYRAYMNANRKATLAGVADLIGINKNSLNNYINGVSIPGAEILYKIAVFFDKTPDYFFDFDKTPVYENKESAAVVANEPTEPYLSEAKAWRVAYETQQKLTDALVEIEHLRRYEPLMDEQNEE